MTGERQASAPISVSAQRLSVHAAGRDWILERTADMESLWDEMDQAAFGEDERLPYWAEVWPASLLVCLWLEREKNFLRGRRCLDLGCGLGLTALVGAWLGAEVLALDYEPRALGFARRNARINLEPDESARVLWTVMDWRAPGLREQGFSRIWGGDILYEKRFFVPLERLFRHCLEPGGEIWLGEPERTVSRSVWDRLTELGWRTEIILRDKVAYGGQNQTVRLWRITR
ncbi:MAG: 50S ribosomal protein L11 methyltransferase [Desulfovibrionaceae bacterium]